MSCSVGRCDPSCVPFPPLLPCPPHCIAMQRLAKQLQKLELEEEKKRRRDVEHRKQQILAGVAEDESGGAGRGPGEGPDGGDNDLVSERQSEGKKDEKRETVYSRD